MCEMWMGIQRRKSLYMTLTLNIRKAAAARRCKMKLNNCNHQQSTNKTQGIPRGWKRGLFCSDEGTEWLKGPLEKKKKSAFKLAARPIKSNDDTDKSRHANVSKCLVGTHLQACISPQTLGGSVTHFKLQKHESSFKHVLFNAQYGVAQSSECAARFPKMLKDQQRFHWHPTKSKTIFISLLQLSPGCTCGRFLHKSWFHPFETVQ